MKKKAMSLVFLMVAAVCVAAHPHIPKTVTAKLGETEATLSYFTMPANMTLVPDVEVGSFSQAARLTLSAEMTGSGVTLPAGDYTVGALRDAENEWTMALYPGRISRGEAPDLSRVIKLNSWFSTDHGTSEHSHLDISPGAGSLEGRTVITWHFGSLFLSGAIN